MLTFRPYQQDSINEAIALRRKHKAPKTLLVAPTGAGKTLIAAGIIQAIAQEDLYASQWLLAHRRELVFQGARKLAEGDIAAGVVMAGVYPRPEIPVQVASIATLMSWQKRTGAKLPPLNALLIDEAHRSMGRQYLSLIEHYSAEGAAIFGFTATPIRADGVGLGRVYQHMVKTPGIMSLIKMGFLVPYNYYLPFVPNLEGVPTVHGDWDPKVVAEIMNQKHLVGDIVQNWTRICPDRLTFVFCSGVQHSLHVAEAFRAAGIPAEHIDGSTKSEKRDKILELQRSGHVRVITNDSVFIEGVDIPSVSCVIIAKPTKSIGRYLQMGGRGGRISDGKKDCILIDHSGCFYRHGRIDQDHHWDLVKGKEMVDKIAQERKSELIDFVCHECKSVFSGSTVCPNCGAPIRRRGRIKDYIDAELVKLTYEQLEAKATPIRTKGSWFAQILWIARAQDKTIGWASKMYELKFKEWPPKTWYNMVPEFPSDEVKGYIVSRRIAFAHVQRKKKKAEETENAG